MYISYSSSDLYSEYTGISLLSLLENNKDLDIKEIFILNNDISTLNLEKILSIGKKYNRKITILDISKVLNEFGEKNNLKKHIGSYSTYARLIPELIYPEYVDYLLVIDSDTIVNGSLKDLPFDKMNDKCIAGINHPEYYSLYNKYFVNKANSDELKAEVYEEVKLFKNNDFYLNCGILLYNLINWKSHNIPNVISNTIKNKNKFYLFDQSVINCGLDKKEILFLDLKYNSFAHEYPKPLYRCVAKEWSKLYSIDIVNEAIFNPVIIHYKGSLMRPWNKYCKSNLKKYYKYYKKKSPWKNTKYIKNLHGVKSVFKYHVSMVLRNTIFSKIFKKRFLEFY